MLDLRVHAGFYIGETLTRSATSRCAYAGKVVLLLVHITAPPVATAI